MEDLGDLVGGEHVEGQADDQRGGVDVTVEQLGQLGPHVLRLGDPAGWSSAGRVDYDVEVLPRVGVQAERVGERVDDTR